MGEKKFPFPWNLDQVVDGSRGKWSLLLNSLMPPSGHRKDKYANRLSYNSLQKAVQR